MSTNEPIVIETIETVIEGPIPESVQCQIFVWPLGRREDLAIVMDADPSSTIITEFVLTGITDEERLEEMRQWVQVHEGFDATVIDKKDTIHHRLPSGLKIVGLTFSVAAPSTLAWWPTVRGY